jgi:uncharacterized protein YheU (UPF0270 family)
MDVKKDDAKFKACAPREGTGSPERGLSVVDSTQDDDTRHQLALGTAVVHVWGELPQEIQEKLFEHAVITGHQSERDESLRETLAKYLHDHHERTLAAQSR